MVEVLAVYGVVLSSSIVVSVIVYTYLVISYLLGPQFFFLKPFSSYTPTNKFGP